MENIYNNSTYPYINVKYSDTIPTISSESQKGKYNFRLI